jgi:hypothetical protein
MTTEQGQGDLEVLRAIVRRIVESGPADFASRATRARTVRAEVQNTLAPLLEPAVNAQLNTMPQDTLEEKRRLASWANHELHDLGLGIRCPLTGRPAVLVANPGRSGDEGEGSRFRIESRDDSGRKQRTPSSGWVPKLELVVYAGRREGRSIDRG